MTAGSSAALLLQTRRHIRSFQHAYRAHSSSPLCMTLSHCGQVQRDSESVFVRDVGVHSRAVLRPFSWNGRFLLISWNRAQGGPPTATIGCALRHRSRVAGRKTPFQGSSPQSQPPAVRHTHLTPSILPNSQIGCGRLRIVALWSQLEFAVPRYHERNTGTIGQRSVKLMSHLRLKCRSSDMPPLLRAAIEFCNGIQPNQGR